MADSPKAHDSRIAEIQRLAGITPRSTGMQIGALRLLNCMEATPGPYRNPHLFDAFQHLDSLLVGLEGILASRQEGATEEELQEEAETLDGQLGAMIKSFSLATHQYVDGTALNIPDEQALRILERS